MFLRLSYKIKHDTTNLTYAEAVTNNKKDKVMVQVHDSNRPGSRKNNKKRKKPAYQYDHYYMSSPDDIILSNLEKGLIK